MKEALFDLIEKYDIITIYRHVSPDSDALGSQFGLKQWIQDTYPEKQVYALGKSGAGSKDAYFPAMDEVDDAVVKQSLAIILDTANSARVDDTRFVQAAYRLKIDHHIYVETFADVEIIEDLMGATCEILATMFMQRKIQISSQCAQYLYGGLIADTLRFSISTITPQTFQVAAYLLSCGVDIAKANEDNFSTSLRLYRYENYIRANCKVLEDKVAYMIVRKEDYERYHVSFDEAKEKVFVMGGVQEFEAWTLFVEKEQDENGQPIFNGSLRSRQKTINDIANAYHGGGHRFACGVKGLKETDIKRLLHDLLDRMNQA